MANWYLKNLGDAMLAGDRQEQITQLFWSAYAQAGNPKEMALFMRHESAGQLHCEVKLYFAPAATVVAGKVDAQPCGKPSPDGLSLLAGSECAWSALFPD